jgi:hypothetical protein
LIFFHYVAQNRHVEWEMWMYFRQSRELRASFLYVCRPPFGGGAHTLNFPHFPFSFLLPAFQENHPVLPYDRALIRTHTHSVSSNIYSR